MTLRLNFDSESSGNGRCATVSRARRPGARSGPLCRVGPDTSTTSQLSHPAAQAQSCGHDRQNILSECPLRQNILCECPLSVDLDEPDCHRDSDLPVTAVSLPVATAWESQSTNQRESQLRDVTPA